MNYSILTLPTYWLNWAFTICMAYDEHEFALWLPWWRRYASVPLAVLGQLLFLCSPEKGWNATLVAAALLFVVANVVHLKNFLDAMRNKRNGRDFKKLEAEQSSMTEVQTQSFWREVVEAK